jgi:phosphatidylcholine synthase
MAHHSKHSIDAIPLRARCAAYLVHIYTAMGAVVAALTAQAIFADDHRTAFFWMAIAVAIDATDGTLARHFHVKRTCPNIDGRTIDDIVDYLNYTFLPLLMICHADWLPAPVWLWAAFPLMSSLFGFAHAGAKEQRHGFFRGFPSYWNIVAFYVAVWLHASGQYVVLAVILGLSILSVLPVYFVYPNRPPKWVGFFVGGAVAWLAIVLWMVYQYPHVDQRWLVASLIYPVAYVGLSLYLDFQSRGDRVT